jgi:hypothetical protein
MWLTLCSSSDTPALWAHHALRAQGLEPLELVTTEMLGQVIRWEHRLGIKGASINFTLNDGREIKSESIRGVLNRTMWIPTEHLTYVHLTDREYAIQEFLAFFSSWLYALPQPVLNRPRPPGLSGQLRHVSEWIWMASSVGLHISDYTQSSVNLLPEIVFEGRVTPINTPINTVFVVNEHVIADEAPSDIREKCRNLADLARTDLLGIEFAEGSESPWTFVGATTLPDLRLGGQAILDKLILILRGKRRAKR